MVRLYKRAVNKPVVLIILAMLLAVCVSRGVSIGHEATLHPDERYFFQSSVSLKDKLLDFDSTYKAAKVYPEGAFVFQVPFHLLEQLLCSLTGQPENARLWGRIASVFYFSLGCVLGALVLYRYFGKKPGMVALYAVIMTFSLFHIEQSRYGTGDAISFFLLTAAVFASALFLEKDKKWFLFLSGFAVGALAAVKYPQLFFLLYPVGALALYRRARNARLRHTLCLAAGLFAATATGFLLFSPSALVNPGYIPEAISRELSSYMVSGNRAEVGSPLEHLVSLLVYQLFYSDLPLSLPIAAYAVFRLLAQAKSSRSSAELFFAAFIPAGMLIFFIYNLFITTVFFRTYYPYFCLCALYTSWGLYQLMSKKLMRAAALSLCVLMVGRGVFFIAVLSESSRGDVLLETLTQHEAWEDRKATVTLGNIYHSGGVSIPGPTRNVPMDALYAGAFPELQPGEFLVTAPLDYCFAEDYLFPITHGLVRTLIDGWQDFKAANRPYYIGQPYPDAYYLLFGYWLHGSSGTMFELPTNYVYYRGYGPTAAAD